MPLPDYREADIRSVLHPATNIAAHEGIGPLLLERGEGIYVFDDRGRRYIEGISGLWCTSLGFGNRELAEAAYTQLRELSFCHGVAHKSSKAIIELAERLKALAPVPISKVFFVSSGSEANETQLKFLWYYNNALGRPQKKKVIAHRSGYHGVTLGAGSLTGVAHVHAGFDLPLSFARHVENPDFSRGAQPGESPVAFCQRRLRAVEALIEREGADTIAAYIAEPVLGAGGVIVPPPDYYRELRALLDRHDIRLIADEVICGFGRTGQLWGSQSVGMTPHSITCAKALASGYLPIGAVLIDEQMYAVLKRCSDALGPLSHGFTFGCHPAPAAVALKHLELLERMRILDHVQAVQGPFQRALEALAKSPLVVRTRGIGLMGAADLALPGVAPGLLGPECVRRAEAKGLIVRAMGDTLAVCPPLIITEEQVHALFSLLAAALDEVLHWAQQRSRRDHAVL